MSNQHCTCEKCRCHCCLCQRRMDMDMERRSKLVEKLKEINKRLETNFDSIDDVWSAGETKIFTITKTVKMVLEPKDVPPVKFAYPKNGGKVAVVASCEIQVPDNIKGLISDISFDETEPNTCFFSFGNTGLAFSSFEEILEDFFYSHILQVARMKCICAKDLSFQKENDFPFALYKTTDTPTAISIKYANMVQVNEYGDMKLAYL